MVGGLSMVTSLGVAFGFRLTSAGTAGVDTHTSMWSCVKPAEVTDNVGLCHGICAQQKTTYFTPDAFTRIPSEPHQTFCNQPL